MRRWGKNENAGQCSIGAFFMQITTTGSPRKLRYMRLVRIFAALFLGVKPIDEAFLLDLPNNRFSSTTSLTVTLIAGFVLRASAMRISIPGRVT